MNAGHFAINVMPVSVCMCKHTYELQAEFRPMQSGKAIKQSSDIIVEINSGGPELYPLLAFIVPL
jgi:hypothetical protein